jgi:hypothetical protein
MTMPSGYTPPAPHVDPVTGLPAQQPPPAPGQQPITINVNDPAQPPPPDPDAPISRAQMDEILNAERERVRQEEKDKLYPQIEELKNQTKALNDDLLQRQEAEAAEAQRLAEEARVAQEAEMSAKDLLERTQTDWEKRFADMQADRDREKVMREQEQKFGQLQAYRAQRMAEESGDIAPQFLDYITGNDEPSIEASIAAAKLKTAEIVQEFQQAGLNNRRSSAPPIAGAPPVDPGTMVGEGQTRELSAEEIRNMSMEEYGQYRSQLLTAGSQRVRDQGLYAP